VGLRIGPTLGNCIYLTFKAYDHGGKLVATDPAPICEDKHGHGATWRITEA